MILKFKKLHPNAQLPAHATEDAAGLDISACLDEAIVIHPGEAAAIPTGLAMELPRGMEAQIRGRSGLAFKHAIFSYNGTIDADYRGEIKGLLINHSRVPFVIFPGMRICQMVVNAAYVKCRPEFAEEINETARGSNGFGSTGTEPIQEGFDDEEGEVMPEINYSSTGQTRYTPSMGDAPPTKEDTMAALLKASQGKKA